MQRFVIGSGIAAALLLGGCETSDPDLGLATRQNVAAQAVDISPSFAGVPMEGSDGVRVADAQRRYLRGQVKPLLQVDADSNVGTQGGASDSGGTSGSGRTAGN